MKNNYFQFKHFRIVQNNAVMRVNTDGVLLGAWVGVDDLTSDDYVLDIGTGTGVIALMLAQRSRAHIDAIEIDSASSEDALKNAQNSIWSNRIRIYNDNVMNFTPVQKYRLIVSNPPYFVNSLASPNNKRNIARHTDNLTYSDLITRAVDLLTEDGTFAVILPSREEERLFCSIADEKRLHLQQITEVYSLPNTPPKRVLMEFKVQSSKFKEVSKNALTIENEEGYTCEYKELTKDFYLKF